MGNRYRNEEYLAPPGTLTELLSHPCYGNSRTIELALFYEHRYAFFFWLKWTRNLKEDDASVVPPALISLDWHQDLCPEDKEELAALNQQSNKEVAIFTWLAMNPNNDGHIMAAAYLNAIGNIYVVCRQAAFESDWEDECLTDINGSVHTIRKFKSVDDLLEALLKSNESSIYFDIDIDFFTIQNPYNDNSKEFTFMPDEEIKSIFSVDSVLMKWIFERLYGFTIAVEPEHSGGLIIANKYLDLINDALFDPPLFTNHGNAWERGTQWRHLKDK